MVQRDNATTGQLSAHCLAKQPRRPVGGERLLLGGSSSAVRRWSATASVGNRRRRRCRIAYASSIAMPATEITAPPYEWLTRSTGPIWFTTLTMYSAVARQAAQGVRRREHRQVARVQLPNDGTQYEASAKPPWTSIRWGSWWCWSCPVLSSYDGLFWDRLTLLRATDCFGPSHLPVRRVRHVTGPVAAVTYFAPPRRLLFVRSERTSAGWLRSRPLPDQLVER